MLKDVCCLLLIFTETVFTGIDNKYSRIERTDITMAQYSNSLCLFTVSALQDMGDGHISRVYPSLVSYCWRPYSCSKTQTSCKLASYSFNLFFSPFTDTHHRLAGIPLSEPLFRQNLTIWNCINLLGLYKLWLHFLSTFYHIYILPKQGNSTCSNISESRDFLAQVTSTVGQNYRMH